MKFLLLLLLAFPVFSQSIPDRVKSFDSPKSYKVEYDKFQKLTSVEVGRANLKLVVVAFLPESDPAWFAVIVADRDLFIRPTLRLLLDGELLEVPTRDIDYRVGFRLSADEFKKIAAAKIVEYQAAHVTGKIDGKLLTQLRNLASLAN